MTTYTRSIKGRPVTIHSGDLDGWEAFTRSDWLFGLDYESTSTDDKGPRMFGPDYRARTAQFGNDHEAYVLDLADPRQREAARDFLADERNHFVEHSNYDVLSTWVTFGIALGQRAVDTMLLALLLEPGERAQHGLKPLTVTYIDKGLVSAQDDLHRYFASIIPAGSGITRGSKAMVAHGFSNADVSEEVFAVYAGLDAIYVRLLWDRLVEACAAFPELVAIENWLAAQTTGITIRGIRLDEERVNAALETVDAEVLGARKRLEDLLGYPALSPRRIDWLEERGVEFHYFTEKGSPSLDKDAVPDLLARYPEGHPVHPMLLDTWTLSQRSNLRSNLHSFLDARDANGRIHPEFKTLRAHTARMSIKAPALQTLKKSDPLLRGCLLFDEGYVGLSSDFKAVELRIGAALAQEKKMMSAILAGTDLHDTTSRLVFGPSFTPVQRKIGKMANFLTVYGGGPKALADQGKIDPDLAVSVIQKFRRAYPALHALGNRLQNETEVVVTDYGRHIPVDPQRSYANLNYLIQSTARDVMVEAVYRFIVEKGYTDALWLLVHDELVVQVPAEDAARARVDLVDSMTLAY